MQHTFNRINSFVFRKVSVVTFSGVVGKCVTIGFLATDLRQISRVGRTMAVDDKSEISFSIPQGTLSWLPVFLANVGLCFCV